MRKILIIAFAISLPLSLTACDSEYIQRVTAEQEAKQNGFDHVPTQEEQASKDINERTSHYIRQIKSDGKTINCYVDDFVGHSDCDWDHPVQGGAE